MMNLLLSPIPQHLAQRLDLLLFGAVICLGAGLLLLLIAVIVLRRMGRRPSRNRPTDFSS